VPRPNPDSGSLGLSLNVELATADAKDPGVRANHPGLLVLTMVPRRFGSL
jgi:hypothetical protein